ncbi:hypothetical protein V2J09_020837 [Rumex salicifolius]
MAREMRIHSESEVSRAPLSHLLLVNPAHSLDGEKEPRINGLSPPLSDTFVKPHTDHNLDTPTSAPDNPAQPPPISSRPS